MLVVAAGLVTSLVQRDLGLGLVALGAFIPLIFLQDLGRYLAFATHRPGRALVLDLTWLGLLVVAVGAVLASGSESLVLFVVAWAGSGAVAGLLTPLPYRHSRIRLGLGWLRETWPFSWRYALSFASMQTASLGVSVAIVGIAGSRALGAVRGALLLLGPFTQFQAASIAAGVAEVSRMQAGSRRGGATRPAYDDADGGRRGRERRGPPPAPRRARPAGARRDVGADRAAAVAGLRADGDARRDQWGRARRCSGSRWCARRRGSTSSGRRSRWV